jgi:hypothetical protein
MNHIDEVLGRFEDQISELTDRIRGTYKLENGIELDREILRLGVRARLAAIEGFMDLYRIGGLQSVYRAGFEYSGTEKRYSVIILDSEHQKAIAIFDVLDTSEGNHLHHAGTSVSCMATLQSGEIVNLKFIESRENIVILE